ncbi:MAG: efflux transporter outer membrane subunit [Burkholderiaceae bacterium]
MTKRILAAAAMAALLATGCANPSGIETTAKLREPQSLGLGAQVQAGAKADADAVAPDWWRAFGDPQLDALVGQALAGSPNLKIAQARLARASAVTEVASAATLPQVNGSLDLTRQQYTKNGAVPAPLAGSIRESGTLQLSASWELDFFGRYQAALDAALGSVQAAKADEAAARVLLSSNVARGYFQLARVDAQLEVARRALAQREEQLRLVRDRVDAGLDTRLELRQSEGGLPDARQQIEALQEQRALARNALAALTGQPAQAASVEARPLAQAHPPATAAVLPADLIGRRADVVAARWRVEAAGHDIANAKAQFYPNLNLVAFAGFSSIGLGRLLEPGSQQWGVGPALRLPIFEGGRLRANLRGKTADYDAAVESYNAAVIDAVREVADQVASTQSIARQQAEQRSAQAAAEGAYEIAVQRYQAGLGNYLQVLGAESAVLAQRRLAVDLAARALDTQVGLMRALGGGYAADAHFAAATKQENTTHRKEMP